jgi:AcrR family transcriptional regulator
VDTDGGRPTLARGGAPTKDRVLRPRGQRTLRRLLDAGEAVFERRGYEAARVDDIVREAHTSHGTFYLYFANKEDLFRALALDVAEEMAGLARSLGPIGPGAAGYRALRGWLEGLADLYERRRAVLQAWTEAETHGSEFGRIGTDLVTEFARTLAERVDSEATVDLDRPIAALALVAMFERFLYFVAAHQLDVGREETLDTLATIAHAGLFGASRRQRRLLARRECAPPPPPARSAPRAPTARRQRASAPRRRSPRTRLRPFASTSRSTSDPTSSTASASFSPSWPSRRA